MDDINARIVVAVESSNAEKQIGRVRDRLTEVTDQRIKDLKIAESKARLEVAECKSMEAAQAAYNAKLQEEAKVRQIINARRGGGFIDEIKQLTRERMNLHAEYLKASEKEASANYQALKAKIAYDNLSKSFNTTGRSIATASNRMKDFTYQTVAARTASRLLRTDLGNGLNPTMLTAGILSFGAMATIRLARSMYDKYIDKLNQSAEAATKSSEAIKNVIRQNKILAQKQESVLSELDALNKKERLSNVDRLKTIDLIGSMEEKYQYLASAIEKTSGKLKDFYTIKGKIEEDLLERSISDVKNEIEALEKEKKSYQKIIEKPKQEKTRWFDNIDSFIQNIPPIYMANKLGLQLLKDQENQIKAFLRKQFANYALSAKDVSSIDRAKSKIDDLDKSIDSLNNKLNELNKKEPYTKNLNYSIALENDRLKTFKEEIKQLDSKLEIQLLLNRGLEREAKILEIRNRLARRSELTEKEKKSIAMREMALFDLSRKNNSGREKLSFDLPYKRFKATAENVIGANTLEGIRLQSRILMDKGGNGKSFFDNAKKQTGILDQIKKDTARIMGIMPRKFIEKQPNKFNFPELAEYGLLPGFYSHTKEKIDKFNEELNKFIYTPLYKMMPNAEKLFDPGFLWEKFLHNEPKGEKQILRFGDDGSLIRGKDGKAIDFNKIADQKILDLMYKSTLDERLYKKIPTKANIEKLFDPGFLWEKFLHNEEQSIGASRKMTFHRDNANRSLLNKGDEKKWIQI